MHSFALLSLGATLAAAQFVPPPPPVNLTTTKSAVLPTLPTPFSGVLTNQGAIIAKGPVVPGYVGLLGPASVQSNLPAATYVASLPSQAFNELTGTVISGSIRGVAQQGGTGVTFTVSLSNLPNSSFGPFAYHIHDSPVPSDGNCTSTLAHFDTTNRGEYYPCDKSALETCQTGDLSGKHGTISGATFNASYTDNFLSTDPSSPYFFGSKSIVIHTSNTTRLTCANFVLSSGGANGTTTGSPSRPTASQPAQYTGSANKLMAGSAVAGLAAIFGFLM
ncbi:Cell surface superoxide dismutase [Sphaceloma murrayae]|uniref:superoxide dismutase n=1 Tax=Sphaceloma murrayae TaxID=2082308 RepID=A0A2K1QM28_9PEZI|nr:Cell surface superoxide dismutase [Sphaceloma murrayae]